MYRFYFIIIVGSRLDGHNEFNCLYKLAVELYNFLTVFIVDYLLLPL